MTIGSAARPLREAVTPHRAPAPLENVKFGFWLFLASECLFFASLVGTYLALHGKSLTGPFPQDVFNIPLTTVSSFVLLTSSLTMVLAVAAIQHADGAAMKRWLAVTAFLGLVLLGFQAYEFTEFVHEGLTLRTNVFGASFYTLTGFHGAHVAIGVIWLVTLLIHALRGGITPDKATAVEVAGLYWHFVDVVWIVIFTVVYLLEFAR